MGAKETGADVGTGVSVGASERTGVEAGAFYWKTSGEGGGFGRVAEVAVESSEKTDAVGEVCERRSAEGAGEAWGKSSAVEGAAGGTWSGGEAAAKGTRTTAEGEAEGRRRWAGVGEAARRLRRRPRRLRRSTGSPFSRGASGNRGTGPCCPVAARLPGACPPRARRPSCVR